jgi:hypothetical protein
MRRRRYEMTDTSKPVLSMFKARLDKMIQAWPKDKPFEVSIEIFQAQLPGEVLTRAIIEALVQGLREDGLNAEYVTTYPEGDYIKIV